MVFLRSEDNIAIFSHCDVCVCVLATDVHLPVVCAVSRKMRIKCTKERSNGRVGGAKGVPVEKKKVCQKNFNLD